MAIDERENPAPPRRSNLLSNLLAVAAVVLGIVALVLYLRNPTGGVAPVPTPAPGGNELVNVVEALGAQGLAIQQPPGLFIPRGALDAPGQGIEIEGNPGFIFLYPDAEAARGDAENADADAIVPERLAGTPSPEGERRLTLGSNVIVLLVGGTDDTWQTVEAAVASLP
ncbi:MAG: hypothetical protein ACRDJC_23255 [Thermomicrobiales bacterium]